MPGTNISGGIDQLRKSFWCRLGLHKWSTPIEKDGTLYEFCVDPRCEYIGKVPKAMYSIALSEIEKAKRMK